MPDIDYQIYCAKNESDFKLAIKLVADYVDWLGVDLSFQNIDHELSSLPEMYGPPDGAYLLMKESGSLIGGVALRKLAPGVCEMKRMYLYPSYHGKGLGREMLKAFLDKARELKYAHVRLDTLPRLEPALALYRSVGFYEIDAYRYNPDEKTVYLEYQITQADR